MEGTLPWLVCSPGVVHILVRVGLGSGGRTEVRLVFGELDLRSELWRRRELSKNKRDTLLQDLGCKIREMHRCKFGGNAPDTAEKYPGAADATENARHSTAMLHDQELKDLISSKQGYVRQGASRQRDQRETRTREGLG